MATQQELQEQLTDLKAEIVDLSQSIASIASKNASDALDYSTHGLRDAAHRVEDQGREMVAVVRDNPGTASTIAISAGLLGLAIGYVIGGAQTSTSRR